MENETEGPSPRFVFGGDGMGNQSATWIRLMETGSEIHFSSVTQIRHSLSLKLATETETTESTDYLNGARVQPAKVTLSLMETDAGHPRGWAARIAQNLEACRTSRALLQIFTPVRNYRNMLLSDLVIIQEEGSPDSWSGTAAFTQADLYGDGNFVDDNSSTVMDIGDALGQTVSGNSSKSGGARGSSNQITDSPLKQLLRKAGIEVE